MGTKRSDAAIAHKDRDDTKAVAMKVSTPPHCHENVNLKVGVLKSSQKTAN
jgi:hypothetical protein